VRRTSSISVEKNAGRPIWSGVINPTEVVRWSALRCRMPPPSRQLMLTTGAMVAEIHEKKLARPLGGHGPNGMD